MKDNFDLSKGPQTRRHTFMVLRMRTFERYSLGLTEHGPPLLSFAPPLTTISNHNSSLFPKLKFSMIL